MNKVVGMIIGAGLLWFGTQQVSNAQSITIEINGGDRYHRNVDLRSNSIYPQQYEPHNGVVYKPSTRLHGGVVYHGISPNPRYGNSPAPVYRENVIIYSDRDDDRNYYNQFQRYRDRHLHPRESYERERIYYSRDRYFRY
jgi:hypothetical protein